MAKFLPGVPVEKGTRGWLKYQSSGTGIVPHGLTTRDQIVVPGGKRLRVDHLIFEIIVYEVATTPGFRQLSLYIVRDGGLINILRGSVKRNVNTIDENSFYNVQPMVFLEEGETLRLYTSDNSTGGKVAYYGHVWYTLFDSL